jgi:hypothetical protein
MKKLWWVLLLLVAGSAWAQCNVSPYYPVRAGWEWSYSSSSGDNHTIGYTNITPTGFVMVYKSSGTNRSIRYNCDANGFTASSFVSPADEGSLRLETTRVSGTAVPSRLAVGSNWRYSYEVRGTFSMGQGGEGINVQGTVEVASRAVAIERVVTPAGTFQALRIEQTTTMKLSGNLNGISIPMPSAPMSTVEWVAEGVGTVKTEMEGLTTQLISLKK